MARIRRTRLLVVLVVVLPLLAIGAANLRDLSQAIGATLRAYVYRVETLSLVREVARGVSTVRGLPLGRDVRVEIVDSNWALRHWAPPVDAPLPPQALYKEVIYKLTLLLPANYSLSAGERRWVAAFMAAVVGDTIYVNADYLDPRDPAARNVLAHELTHVLQHLNLPHVFAASETTDSMLAKAALIEGDAGFTQYMYCTITGACTPSPRMQLSLEDPYVALLSFPYVFGEDFVRALYKVGGWELVNRAYLKPPTSTAHVMFVERYLAYLLNVTAELVKPEVGDCRCRASGELASSDVLGAYYLTLVVGKRIGLEKAREVAGLWVADLAELYAVPEGGWCLCWNITLSSVEGAREVFAAFGAALGVLQGGGAPGEAVAADHITSVLPMHGASARFEVRLLGCSVLVEAELTPLSG